MGIRGKPNLETALKKARDDLMAQNQRAVFIFTFDGHIHFKDGYIGEREALLVQNIEKLIREGFGI